jgi:glyceraldehyde 3-phosphate dehydrogenase
MAVRVGINGFGRIGRIFFRAARLRDDIEVVAINDLTSPEMNAHLLKYDSTHGRFGESVRVAEDGFHVGDDLVKVFSESDPKALPWGDVGVDVVVESTGFFTDGHKAGAHIEAGAPRVIISAPATNVDATFVVGVNDDTFDPAKHKVMSNASCTTNCFVPMVKVLDDAFGVEKGLMTTVHAYTNDQALLDVVNKSGDLRRMRAAAQNIVPNSTGAARATSLVLEAMKGRLDGTALRVPVQESGPLSKVLVYTEDQIVSSDIIGSPASCTFSPGSTMAMGSLVKVFGWYDNEWGYSNRLVDLAQIVGAANVAG